MTGFHPRLMLALGALACPSPGMPPSDPTGSLVFTNANVVRVTGGYTVAAVPVPPGIDLCFDTSGVDGTVANIMVAHVGMGDAGLRCTLGRNGVTQADITGGLWSAVTGATQTCLATMDLMQAEPFLHCEEGTTWLVAAFDLDGTLLANRILDPCGESEEALVVIDATEPTFSAVGADVQAATPFSVTAGVQYTLDWSGVSIDAFGAAVDPEDLYITIVADLAEGVDLADAVLEPGDSSEDWHELWAHRDATVRELSEAYTGPGFPGFEGGHRYLLGFSPPHDCIQASVIATVQVAEP